MRIPAAVLALALTAPLAGADDFDVTVVLGRAVPFYDQQLAYNPGALNLGVELTQEAPFVLEAHGALTVGGAVAWRFAGPLALEARLDTADVSVRTQGPTYQLRIDLPAPLPPLSSQVSVAEGTVDLDRLRPVSLGLRLRTGGPVGVTLSAGVSYLPAFRFVARQPLSLASSGLPIGLALPLGDVVLEASSGPDGKGEGRWGGQVGAGLRVRLSPHVDLVAEGRGFAFSEVTLAWQGSVSSVPGTAVQEALVQQIAARLEPVRFSPAYFHVAGGISLGF